MAKKTQKTKKTLKPQYRINLRSRTDIMMIKIKDRSSAYRDDMGCRHCDTGCQDKM